MGDGWRDNQVNLVGTVESQEPALFIPLAKKTVCRVNLKCEAVDIPVVAFGELAEKLATCLAKTEIHVGGRLVQHVWETGEHKERRRLEVEIDALEVKAKS